MTYVASGLKYRISYFCNISLPYFMTSPWQANYNFTQLCLWWLARIPEGRSGQLEEIAGLAVFLPSEEADDISGAAIVIEGAWLTT